MPKTYNNNMSFKISSKVFLLSVTAILLSAILCDGQNLMKITGKVIDEKGEDFPGVSIRVKGTNTGAITDITGQFTINAAQNAILVFGAIGYTAEEILVINQQPINISLKISAKDLEQVVVVGYGSQRKVDITGATSSIKGEDLVKQPIMTPTQALQGKLAGVRIIASGKPGSSPTVNIRGMGTALAGTSALFVVDGVLTDDISNINTADIVNIDVLKDASSSAIYGARGANGVVIITTKKGTTGAMKVNYSYTYGIKEATNLVQMANASEYVTYAGESSGKNIVAGSFSTDWYSKILRQANMQQHNFSFSGGTEKNTYFLSMGLLQDEGIVLNNNFKRYTARLNNDFIINKYLKAGLVTSFANSKDKNVDLGSAYNNAYRAAPIIPGFLNNKYGNTSAYQNVGNAILDLNKEDNQTKLNRLQGSGYLTIQPAEWISFRSAIGGDYLISSNKIYSYQFDNDEVTFLSAGGNQRNPNSSLSLTKWNSFRWVWDNIVTLNKKIKDHTLGLTLGTTSEEFIKDDPISGFRKDVPLSANLWYLSAGNANTSTNDSPDPDKWRRESYLSRFNYNFQDKYLFTATVRRDGSSRFSEANRWGIFPSMGAGWVISNESFLQNQNIFETIKLRASWGQVGNDRIPSDAYITTINTGLAYPFGGGIAVPGGAIAQIKDKNLKWETTEELDFGLEYSALKGKLQGEIGFYDKKSRDLLINVKIPSVLGDQDQQVLTNAASIKNTGIEIAANWRDKISNSINYNIGGNISFNKNRVIGLNGGQPILDGGLGAQPYTTKTDNNQPVGSYYVLKTMGVFQTNEEIKAYVKDGNLIQPDATPGDFKYQDTNADGKIDDKDRVFAGTYQPKAIFGANLGLSYKSFDFSIDAYGNIGNKIYNGKRAFRFNDLDNVEQIIVQSRWTPGSGINNQPKANGGNQLASDYFIENGDFVRINNISLAYNLPSKWAKKALIASAKVFVTAQNLITFTKYSGFTPELSNDRPTSAGIELNAYPTNKTIAMGVNIGF
jgi:TonB-dependent starch-binding outer membrane protein SusC